MSRSRGPSTYLSISSEGTIGNKEKPSKRYLRVLASVAESISKEKRTHVPGSHCHKHLEGTKEQDFHATHRVLTDAGAYI